MGQRQSKAERQQWWKSLSLDEQQDYIERRQAKKAEQRKNRPKRVLEYNPAYPWMTEGVNDSNREQWLRAIHKKNPWLREPKPLLFNS
ncbi:MAG TPA: hypothetical protein ENH82_08475 [bacterium]|nr:hypothetical protein [bacterium]